VNAAGCGAALSEYGEFLGGDKAAHAFASRVIDVSALLVREGYERPSSSLPPLRVAYDAPCHLFHAQKVKNEPREILKSIPGVQLVEHQESERCCGSAGIYNVTHYRMSMEVLTAKMREIAKVRPDVIATGNPGCHIQLSEGVRRSGLEAEVVHPVVLLDRAYRSEAG
jgi:glycolate oxidase iron-sulfur subunit